MVQVSCKEAPGLGVIQEGVDYLLLPCELDRLFESDVLGHKGVRGRPVHPDDGLSVGQHQEAVLVVGVEVALRMVDEVDSLFVFA